MIFEIILAIIIGTCFGIFTGLTPGVHINLVSVLILTFSPVLLQFTSPLILSILIVAMGVTHTFLDFIPSCFLGAPDPETSLSVLPAHKLLLEGRGYEAVKLATIGSLVGLIITVILTMPLIFLLNTSYEFVSKFIPYILISASLILIIREKSKWWGLILFLLSGILGIGVLNLNLNQPLLPLFSGLFGIPMLVLSLKDNIQIPKQTFETEKISLKELSKNLSAGLFASTLLGFLPGLGAAEAAIIASSIIKKKTVRGFLILIGSINTIVMILSFIALFTIEKARNGAVLVISKLMPTITYQDLIIFLAISVLAGIISTFLALKIAKIFSRLMTKVSYQKICISIIILIILIVVILTGFLGLFVLIVSTFLGMIPQLKNIGRHHLMGSLILPVILFFLL